MKKSETIDLRDVFAHWYGPEDRPATLVPGEFQWLPQPLKEWYELNSRRRRSHQLARRFFSASDIKIEDDKGVFMSDPNEGWRWAFDLRNTATVYSSSGGRQGWCPVAERLSEFLIHHALDELAFAPTAWKMTARDVADDVLSAIDASMDEVAFGGWSYPYPGARLYFAESLVAQVFPAISDYRTMTVKYGLFDVAIGATSVDHLRTFDALRNIEWFRRKPELLAPSDWPS